MINSIKGPIVLEPSGRTGPEGMREEVVQTAKGHRCFALGRWNDTLFIANEKGESIEINLRDASRYGEELVMAMFRADARLIPAFFNYKP